MSGLTDAQKQVARMHAGLSDKRPGDYVEGRMVTTNPSGGLMYKGDRINTIGDTIYRNGIEVGKVSDLGK